MYGGVFSPLRLNGRFVARTPCPVYVGADEVSEGHVCKYGQAVEAGENGALNGLS